MPTGNPDRRLEDHQARVVHIKMNFMGVHVNLFRSSNL